VDGDRMVLGQYVIPDVSVWAFERAPGQTSPVIEGEVAFYVFRVDSLHPEGVAPLAQVREQVVYQARLEKKTALWRARAQQLADELKTAPSLEAGAAARGLRVDRAGPFSRLRPPPILQLEPTAIGTAFALRPGERSGVVMGEHRAYIIESQARTLADSAKWIAQRDAQRESLLETARQNRVEQYLTALRKQAKVVDRRKEIFRFTSTAGG